MNKGPTPFTYNTEMILSVIDSGVYGTDALGTIEFCNDQLATMLGYVKEELIGQQAHQLFHERTTSGAVRDEVDCMLCQTSSVVSKELSNLLFWTKQGNPIVVNCIIRQIESAGKNKGAIVSCQVVNQQARSDVWVRMHNYLLEMILSEEKIELVVEELSRVLDTLLPGTLNALFRYESLQGHLHYIGGRDIPMAQGELSSGLDQVAIAIDGFSDVHSELAETTSLDMTCNPIFQNFYYYACEQGLQNYFSYPILSRDEHVLGLLSIHHKESWHPSYHELTWVESCAHLASLVMERESRDQQIQELAFYDEITKLPNRAHYWDTVTNVMEKVKESQELKLALFFFDVDRFRTINESLGHEVGDELLQAISGRIVQFCGDGRFAARMGGDEFILIFNETISRDQIVFCAQEMIHVMAKPFALSHEQTIHITISMGVAIYPEHGDDIYTLTKNAETAMYVSKDNGRNTVKFYTPLMKSQIDEKMWMAEELERAMEEQQFAVYYQPKMNIVTGQITSAEALLRWFHPVRGTIPPVQFIPIAEDTGKIIAIGEWVLRMVCKQLQTWQTAGVSCLRIAVNVSPKQFQHPQFIPQLKDIILEFGVDPLYIEIEITESTLMDNTEETIHKLMLLKQMGIHVSIDDFGIGYSSLNYLKRFPVDALKIDQSFIREVQEDSTSAIVTLMIALAHRLQMRVIAEGVETEWQLDFLRFHGCDEIQGYFLSRPMAVNDLETFIVQFE